MMTLNSTVAVHWFFHRKLLVLGLNMDVKLDNAGPIMSVTEMMPKDSSLQFMLYGDVCGVHPE